MSTRLYLKPFWGCPFRLKIEGAFPKILGCDAGRGFLSGRWWPPITIRFLGWKKSCCPRTTSLEPSEASSSSWRNRALIGKTMGFSPKWGEKKQTWKTTWREWKFCENEFKKKKRPPISWVQSFWGKKTSVYIGYRLGYRSARHISYNTLSKGPSAISDSPWNPKCSFVLSDMQIDSPDE